MLFISQMCVHSMFLVNIGYGVLMKFQSLPSYMSYVAFDLLVSTVWGSFQFHSATYFLYLPLILCLLAFKIVVFVSSLFYMFNSQTRTQAVVLSFMCLLNVWSS